MLGPGVADTTKVINMNIHQVPKVTIISPEVNPRLPPDIKKALGLAVLSETAALGAVFYVVVRRLREISSAPSTTRLVALGCLAVALAEVEGL
jgi:hypothetical protein